MMEPVDRAKPPSIAPREARFSSLNPDGIRPFEMVLVPVPLGKQGRRVVAPLEPDRSRWGETVFRDPQGRGYVVRTVDQLGRGMVRFEDHGTIVAPSLGEWLGAYFEREAAMMRGPDDRPCSTRTRGALGPMPVRIVGVAVAGQEPHRRRLEEAVAGWDVQVAQTRLGRMCRAPRCETALRGRQRLWCARHKAYPGRYRNAWMQVASGPMPQTEPGPSRTEEAVSA
jgi:hypothetical protein